MLHIEPFSAAACCMSKIVFGGVLFSQTVANCRRDGCKEKWMEVVEKYLLLKLLHACRMWLTFYLTRSERGDHKLLLQSLLNENYIYIFTFSVMDTVCVYLIRGAEMWMYFI